METINKKKILMVDDDNNLRLVLTDKLKSSGFEVVGASNGQEGLEKALVFRPDVILLDILMPVMNGWDMLKKLREDSEWGKKVKVIVLTGVEGAEAVAKTVQDGSFAFLVKTDQTIDEIIEKIEAMLKE